MLLLSMILQALCDFDMYLWQASPKCKRLLWLLFPFSMFLLSKWLHNLTTNQNVSVECFQLPCKVCVFCIFFFYRTHTHAVSPPASFTYFVSFPPLFLAFAYISQTVEIVLQTKLSLAQVGNRMHMQCFNSCDIIMCLSCIQHLIVLNLKILFKNKIEKKKPN